MGSLQKVRHRGILRAAGAHNLEWPLTSAQDGTEGNGQNFKIQIPPEMEAITAVVVRKVILNCTGPDPVS